MYGNEAAWHQKIFYVTCIPIFVFYSRYNMPVKIWREIKNTKMLTWNFQGIFLGVKQDHFWHQGWPCPPSLWSGTLNFLQVPPFLTPHSWHTSNKDINMKMSGYLPWGQTRSSMTSRVTLSFKSPVRNFQCPPSTPILEPPFLTHSNTDINTKHSEYVLWGQTRSSMTSRMTLFSMSPVRNPQHPPSTTMKVPQIWTHF